MVASKSPRNAAWEGLKRLAQERADIEGPLNHIFHWGIIATKERPRDAREDRAHALVAAAIVEQALEHVITPHFCRSTAEIHDQMFDGDGAVLRDLSAKVKLAYMLGIIGKQTRSDLSAIRRIRNTFAHSRLKIDFETPEIEAACQQISLPERWAATGASPFETDARERYLTCCLEFSIWLFAYPSVENKGPRGFDDFQGALLRA